MKQPLRRCAVYTRKSSEEGLDQEFNSLDAQREAGEAYVRSQASEGWGLLPARYDDGGYSGGSMDRPALKALLADVEQGLIDIIVVYKIDRLTRSLADFARMVELFDRHAISFVSVTQSFNTTSSMGRLTLNVLLSFAQFEREVTGERIRDKIAASKARGMWMGGTLPLGYDRPTDPTRALVVNQAEAAIVRHIFASYQALGSVHALERQLAAEGIVTKRHPRRDGSTRGGGPFSRGALFHLLRNRTYLGQIVHKDKAHPGAHDPIIAAPLFDAVQAILDRNARRSAAARVPLDRAPLTGRLFDEDGNPMSPSFSRGKSGKLYRYYVSAPLQQGARMTGDAVRRVSASTLDRLVAEIIGTMLPSDAKPLDHIRRVEIHRASLHILVDRNVAARIDRQRASDIEFMLVGDSVRLVVPCAIGRRGSATLRRANANDSRPDPSLIKALRKARVMLSNDAYGMPVIEASPSSPYLRKLVRLAFLAPDLQRDILDGRQPVTLTLERLIHMDIPYDWAAQRQLLGWSAR